MKKITNRFINRINERLDRVKSQVSNFKFQFSSIQLSISNFQFPESKFLISIFILLITLSACSSEGGEHQGHQGQAAATTYTCPMHPQIVEREPGSCPICGMDLVAVNAGDADSPSIMLSESQVLLANIKTQQVGRGTADQQTVLTGRVAQNENLTEVISSRVPGRIERLYIKESGQQIRQGQPLYDIYSEELLTYQQEYLLALEQYEQLGEEEPRYASFVESARRRLKLYGMTDAQINQLSTRKKSEARITFLSPASGVITDVSAVEGQYVQEGGRLYSITRLDPLWVEAELYQGDIERVREGMEVLVQVEDFSGPVKGTVTFVSPEFRSSSQIVNMRVEIQNPNGNFIPGMQANVLLPSPTSGEQEERVSLPVEAVIQDQQGAHVWVSIGENTFEPRRVGVENATADQVIITDGLEPDERVVVSGAYLLYSEYVLKKGGNPLNANAKPATASATKSTDEAPSANQSEQERVVPKREEFALAFTHYLQLKKALVNSDPQQAKEQAAALQLALEGLGEGKQAAEYAGRVARAEGLEDQREQFFFLSNHFIEVAEGEPLESGELFVQFCPMANNGQGAYWLSASEEILNPYLPENMLSCGEVTKVIE